MSILSDIKAAREAKREAEREWEKYVDVLVPSEESRHAALIVGRARNRMVALLTDDTIAALIAVAEAAHINEECVCGKVWRYDNYAHTEDCPLAPLVKEVGDD